jgi:natural product biosynthesis luciferase-like monooxygenase protein
VELSLERQDLSGLTVAEREERVEAYLAAERARGMALTAAPLLRLALLRESEKTGTLVLGYHPLLLDAASARLCLEELFRLYEAARKGGEAGLEKPRPYREYLAWVEQQDTKAAESHFRETLRGTRGTALPEREASSEAADGSTPALVQQLLLSPAATAGLQGLMRQQRLTLGALVQAAWALLLRARTGASDVVFGGLVSGRPSTLPRSETLVGRFAHALPVRLQVPASGSLTTWLRDLQPLLAAARAHEHASLTQVRTWVDAPADASLFQSAVATEPIAEEENFQTLARGLGFHGLYHVPASGFAPLLISVAAGPRLALRFQHEARRFSPATVTRLAGRLGAVLEAMGTQPQQDVSALLALAGAGEPERQGPKVTAGESFGPADLEAVLAQNPLVREVAVKARGNELVAQVVPAHRPGKPLKMGFTLFFFADEADGMGNKYRVYLEAAKFADRNGFNAVWTPERHFHAHGGLYPNPSVLNAALATITERIGLRAGSVVLPLHHPLRLAEEWSVVDNLSNGRAAISITSGWVPNDFAFAPENYAKKRDAMFTQLELMRQLWKGGKIPVKDGVGNTVELGIYPRPIQPELPIWMTCSGGPDLFVKAGEMGMNVLTSLLQQSLEDAATKLETYRQARTRAGHDAAAGTVSMMIHTFLGQDPDEVLEKVRGPLTDYLRSHVELMKTLVKSLDLQVDINEPKYLDMMVSFAFERYYRTSALIGTPTSCLGMVERLANSGVDEMACFLDFGVDSDAVLESLTHLAELKRLVDDEALRTQRLLGEYLAERYPGQRRPVSVEVVEVLG